MSENTNKKVRNESAQTVPDVTPKSHPESDDSDLDDVIEPYRPSFYRGPTHLAVNLSPQRRLRSTFVCRGYRAQNERNIFTQLSLIVIAFMIGYIPVTIYLVWTTANSGASNGEVDYWFGVVSYLCLRLSECMNPIMYNLGSSNIRNATKKLLRQTGMRFRYVKT